jgi:hypothetical protein
MTDHGSADRVRFRTGIRNFLCSTASNLVSSGHWSISPEVKRPGYKAEYSMLELVELCLHSLKRPLGMVFDINNGCTYSYRGA